MFAAHIPALSYLLVLFVAWIGSASLWAKTSLWPSIRQRVPARRDPLRDRLHRRSGPRRQAMWVIGAFVLGTAFTAAYGLVLRPDPNGQVGRATRFDDRGPELPRARSSSPGSCSAAPRSSPRAGIGCSSSAP